MTGSLGTAVASRLALLEMSTLRGTSSSSATSRLEEVLPPAFDRLEQRHTAVWSARYLFRRIQQQITWDNMESRSSPMNS